jgi:hypothetical protein
LACFFDRFAALDGFFANIEQTDRRCLVAGQRRDQCRAENSKLKQVFGVAINVRPQVEHGCRATFGVRELRCDRRAVDAVECLEQVARNRHQRTGVAGRDGSLRRTVLDLLDRDAHRRILLLAQGDFNGVVHAHHLARGDDAGTWMRGKPRQCGRRTDQQQRGFAVPLEKRAAGRERDTRPMVAPHAIHGERDCGRRSSDFGGRRRSHQNKGPTLQQK